MPPTINEDEVDPEPHVNKDESITLHCPAYGVPPPNIIWLKEGQPIDFELLYYVLEVGYEYDLTGVVISLELLSDMNILIAYLYHATIRKLSWMTLIFFALLF